MKIIKCEVRTHYTLELSVDDVMKAFDEYGKSRTAQVIHPGAFDVFTSIACEDSLKLLRRCGGDTFAYLSEHLGFDGWENAGYYNEETKRYIFCVYRIGAHF